ncbi:MAG: hypothetical protein V4635_03135 [Bacteroidota bacterium]
MSDKKLNLITGLLFVILLTTLVFKLRTTPGGMILSGFFIGSMLAVGLLMIAFILTTFLRTITDRYSFLTFFFGISSIFILGYHYYLYSPILQITVPKNYEGSVNLVLSNSDYDVLTTDTNGIGYISESTYNKVYSRPQVFDSEGNRIDELCIPYNQATFWGRGRSTSTKSKLIIRTISFDITPKEKQYKRQIYSNDLFDNVDPTYVLSYE